MENSKAYDVIIVGGGPAGLTAGIYAARSGLKTVILEKAMVGGQVSITPMVENWPGFRSIAGKQLMEMINAQVRLLRFELQTINYLFKIYQKRAELEEVIGGPL